MSTLWEKIISAEKICHYPGAKPGDPASYIHVYYINSCVYALPVSFGGYTESRRSLLYYGVYARGSKTFHQSALKCVTVVDSTTLKKVRLCSSGKRCPALYG